MQKQLLTCNNCAIGSCALQMLTASELDLLDCHAHYTQFERGELLLRQDSPFHSIIYLRNGLIKEYAIHRNGPDQIIQLITPRTYIGLQSLFTTKTSIFSYRAVFESEVCFIERDIFSELISGNGKFAREIMVSLSQESLNTQQRILGLNKKQIYGKVAEVLLYLSEHVFHSGDFRLPLSRSEMAQMVASTRESVTKTLIWFKNEGMIEMQKNEIRIVDRERMLEIALRG